MLYEHDELWPVLQCECILSLNNDLDAGFMLHIKSHFSILIQQIESCDRALKDLNPSSSKA